jgi:hypothetical protein
MKWLSRLDQSISAVAPIYGVSVADETDKATWRIDYAQDATPEQRAAADAVIAAFEPSDLATVKAEAKAQIDLDAEHARLRYITAGAGQALEYQEASDEAVRITATGGVGLYPMLQASVDAGEASDLAAAATLVLQRENACTTIFSEIRRLRLSAKRAVDQAETYDGIWAATSVVWP